MPVVKEFKFLRLFLDPKLNFLSHIHYLCMKCKKTLDILKVLFSTDWGSDQNTLLMLYKSVILSKQDYASLMAQEEHRIFDLLTPFINRAYAYV
ncbi:hypothetical protein BOW16_12965 [Solemya velum gill symbiont]|nr:hypothetical protein BOW16_12965 [Solemya velum gill symbiont]